MPPAEEASKPRYSIAFFAQPNRSSVVQGLQKKYPPITAGDYVLQVGLYFQAGVRYIPACIAFQTSTLKAAAFHINVGSQSAFGNAFGFKC